MTGTRYSRANIHGTPPYPGPVCYLALFRCSEGNNFSESLAPNWFELMNELKPRKARFQKTASSFFWRRRPRNYENVTVVARQRQHSRLFLAVCFVPNFLKKRIVCVTQEFTPFLSIDIVTASSHALSLGHVALYFISCLYKWWLVVWFQSRLHRPLARPSDALRLKMSYKYETMSHAGSMQLTTENFQLLRSRFVPT